ncbi:MAG: glycosyltransferase family 2 protein [Phycisphaerales bacterium]|nr:glycosyltransferase family 2 protein [Phycisphaerae bacterium]NNF44169.1 glycosyltransferase family 2 protein [Phycisphaerales bacterium]NNM25959.1 glycosyltransferase family 2 protein [Phycisphaerales bacterium]
MSVREDTFVVVPAFNERSCIEQVVQSLRREYPHVVVVDDGSRDDTVEIARGCATYVLRHEINCGQGAALQTGIEFALSRGARYIVTFDADDQHRVGCVSTLLEPIVRGECEITLGSRFLGEAINLSEGRRLMLRVAILFTRLVNRLQLTDAHNGLRAFSREAAQRIRIRADRMAHASEILDIIRHSGLSFREVPVRVHYTPYSIEKGQSPVRAFRIVFHYVIARVFQ